MRKLLLLPLLVLGLAAAAPAGANTVTVPITATGFPAVVSVQNGDTVTWKNNDTVNRQVVADDKSWQSPVLKPGDTWSHVFVAGGTFSYHGAFKPTQKGTIQVAATRSVQITTKHRVVPMFRAVKLDGSVSNSASNGEEVVIQAKAARGLAFHNVARTTTNAGEWKVMVRPHRNTVYRAVWQNVPSAAQTVYVKPLVRIKQVGRNLFAVGVHADTTLARHWVRIQRWNKRTHVWHSFMAVRLTRVKASLLDSQSIRPFHVHLAHGSIIRALITRRQAAPIMYGPAWSKALRV